LLNFCHFLKVIHRCRKPREFSTFYKIFLYIQRQTDRVRLRRGVWKFSIYVMTQRQTGRFRRGVWKFSTYDPKTNRRGNFPDIQMVWYNGSHLFCPGLSESHRNPREKGSLSDPARAILSSSIIMIIQF